MITEQNIDTLHDLSRRMRQRCPISAEMVRRIAVELTTGGPIAEIINQHPDANIPLFPLRLLAGTRFIRLSGGAQDLHNHLASLPDDWQTQEYQDRTWSLFTEAVLQNRDALAEPLARPVQQHMPQNALSLLRGLAMLGQRKVRLFELGACAGLTLIPDKYLWVGPNWQWGDAESTVRLAADGPAPETVTIVERAGCDLNPLDVSDPHDVRVLRSYSTEELPVAEMDLLDAISLASRERVSVDKGDAATWLEQKLTTTAPDVTTVIWHSYFWGFLSAHQQAAIEAQIASAAQRMKIAVVCWEPYGLTDPPHLEVRVY
jgi:hypothetical protein